MTEIKLNHIDNVLYTRKLDLDLEVIRSTVDFMYEYIRLNFVDDGKGYNGQSTLTTKLYDKYNYLLYPVPGNYELFNYIKETFHAALTHSNWNVSDQYYIQCWLNVYRKGEFIDWHHHGTPDMNSWHGFYCVDVEPNSFTAYKFPDIPRETIVNSENNLIVIGPTNGDLHRSSEWNEETPRVTIAFDIVPANILFERGHWETKNHWIPI
jgi:hypothetical protein